MNHSPGDYEIPSIEDFGLGGEDVEIPIEYIATVAASVSMNLQRMHVTKNITVSVAKRRPIVRITWVSSELAGARGYEMQVDCAKAFAWMKSTAAEDIGKNAAVDFERQLSLAMSS